MTQQLQSHIPTFASREEEASFWQTHDFTDFLDESNEVEVQFADNLSASLTIRLTPAMLAHLRTLAKHKGVSASALARRWIVERFESLPDEQNRS